jgi:putative exosortase-associated protein (TIGR04073 family)
MRKIFPLLAAVVIAGSMAFGCAGPEKKLARGISNSTELLRLRELRHEVEQSALFDTSTSYSSGVIRGIEHTFIRTGIGVFELVTFPIPNHQTGYGPVATHIIQPTAPYPDNFKPLLIEDSMFATDVNIGFSGGDISPFIIGSRFRIFETH